MSRSTTDPLAIVAALALGACRFGGPSGDPTMLFADAIAPGGPDGGNASGADTGGSDPGTM